MRKQWVSAVVMVALALGITVPAWADCKVQMVLSAPGVGNTATGTAEKNGGDHVVRMSAPHRVLRGR